VPVTTKRNRGRPKDGSIAARRREEILEAAAKIFARTGYRKTDLEVVAQALGVGKGTIYRYFPSKEKLFLAAVDRGMKRLREATEAEGTRGPDLLDRIARGIRSYLAYFDAHPEFCELLVQERAEFKDRKKPTYFENRESSLALWEKILQTLMAQGRVRIIPIQRITDVIGDLLYGTMFTNFFAGRQRSFEEQAKDILDIVLFGLFTDEERERCSTRSPASEDSP
jgi:AcrR family transcriptional regulator